MSAHEPPARTACAFCGACERMSNEHVYPTWMTDVLPPQTQGRFTHSRIPDRGEPTSWSTAKLDVKARIGKACNEGWMSDLEGEAKPVLRKLIAPTRPHVTLPKAAQDVLARWITKTVYMADLANGTRLVPATAFRELHDTGQPPKHARIWLTAYGGSRVIHSRRIGVTLEPIVRAPVLRDDGINGYVATMALGHLAFQFIHFFDVKPAVPEDLADVMLVPIWPPQGRSQFWPAEGPGGGNAFDDDGFDSLALRFGAPL